MHVFNSDDFKEAVKAAERAISIFTTYYGPSYQDVKEMAEMVETIKSLSLHL